MAVGGVKAVGGAQAVGGVKMASPKPAGAAPRASGGARGFERRPWGGFQTLVTGVGYKVKRLVVQPGHRLSLQRHRFRAEYWVIVAGSPRIVVGGKARRLKPRATVGVPRGAWHRIENPGRRPVVIIEVQQGPHLVENDIIRRHDDYGRAGRR